MLHDGHKLPSLLKLASPISAGLFPRKCHLSQCKCAVNLLSTGTDLCMTSKSLRVTERERKCGEFCSQNSHLCSYDWSPLVVFIKWYILKSSLSARTLYNISIWAPSCVMWAVSDGFYPADDLHTAVCFQITGWVHSIQTSVTISLISRLSAPVRLWVCAKRAHSLVPASTTVLQEAIFIFQHYV